MMVLLFMQVDSAIAKVLCLAVALFSFARCSLTGSCGWHIYATYVEVMTHGSRSLAFH